MYLLDANVLIDANRDYYPLERVPEFWEWLLHQGEAGRIKIPLEIYEEFSGGNDDLAAWASEPTRRSTMVLDEEPDADDVRRVIGHGYAEDLTDDEIEKLGRDPFLIAYAYRGREERIVVTTERSKPKQTRANRHVPDVCSDLGVEWCDTFRLLRDLDFRTGWRAQ